MVYGYYCFFNVYFDRSQVNRRREFLFYFAFFLLSGVSYLLLHMPLVTIFCNLLSLLLIVCLYPGGMRYKLSACVSSYALAMVLESVSYTLFTRFEMESNLEAAMGTLFPAIGLFALSLVLKRIRVPRQPGQFNILNWLAIFLLSLGSILIMFVTLFLNDHFWSVFITAIVFIVTNIIVFHLLDMFDRYYQSLNTKQILEQQSQAYASELRLIRQNEQKISILRHDLANHLTAIRHFAETGETEKLAHYLDTFSQKLVRHDEYVHSGNLGCKL